MLGQRTAISAVEAIENGILFFESCFEFVQLKKFCFRTMTLESFLLVSSFQDMSRGTIVLTTPSLLASWPFLRQLPALLFKAAVWAVIPSP